MSERDILLRTIEYDFWANKLVSNTIISSGCAEKALSLFGHILYAQRIWYGRLTSSDISYIEVFPQENISVLQQWMPKIYTLWKQFLAEITKVELDKIIEYKNSVGTKYTATTSDILNHVFLHSAYHRGQIALVLRNENIVPPITDFMAFTRI